MENGSSYPRTRPRAKLPISDPLKYRELRPFFQFFIMADTNFLFPTTLRKPETKTLWGLVIGSFALGRILGSYGHFFTFFIMANINFPFPLTLGKPETQTLGGSVMRSFTLGHILGSYDYFTAMFRSLISKNRKFASAIVKKNGKKALALQKSILEQNFQLLTHKSPVSMEMENLCLPS